MKPLHLYAFIDLKVRL